MGYRMAGALFDCSEVVAVAKKSDKNKDKNKKRKGDKGNTEEGKKSPSDYISTNVGMMIRSTHLGRRCG